VSGARPPFITLAGIDGAGKSTVASRLADRMAPSTPVAMLDTRNARPVDPSFDGEFDKLHQCIWTDAPWDVQLAMGHRHFYRLLGAWFGLLDEHVVTPRLTAGEAVIADGWVHKSVARAALRRDRIPEVLDGGFDTLTSPSLTMLLDIPPEVSYARKAAVNDLTPVECGEHDGYAGGRQGFMSFQTAIRQELRRRADQEGWAIVEVTRASTTDEVIDAAWLTIKAHLRA